MQQYQDLKLVTALHALVYSAIIRRIEIRGNCFAFRATVTGVFIFKAFLSEINVLPPSTPRVLSL
jgi:hypothetical protein